MSLPYKKVLVVGATSGIGLELAERLVQEGVFVIAVGRRQANLDAFVSKAGAGKAAAVAFDLVEIEKVPEFVQGITKAHPDLDSVVLNAGVQYVMDFSKPYTVDISKIQHEMTINYTSMVALTHAFMPFFQAKPATEESSFIYTTTALETLPYPLVINYSASKAALRAFILSVRELLKDFAAKDSSPKINVVEIYTPLVQTELHDGQPGWGPDFNPGMPVAEYVGHVLDGFRERKETIAVGPMAKAVWDEFEEERGKRIRPQWEAVKKALGSAHKFE